MSFRYHSARENALIVGHIRISHQFKTLEYDKEMVVLTCDMPVDIACPSKWGWIEVKKKKETKGSIEVNIQ